jgi:hypothetical protein
MALKMQDSQPLDSSNLHFLDRGKLPMAAAQRVQIVGFTREVNFNALVPICPIDVSPVSFVHRAFSLLPFEAVVDCVKAE